MNKTKRIFSVLLAMVLVIGAMKLPLQAEAADGDGMSFSQTRVYYTDKVLGDAPKTYEAVVKFPAGYTSRGGVMIGNYGAGKETVGLEIYSNGVPRLYVSSGGSSDDVQFSGVNVYTGDWVHIAIVHESETTLKCYINGELQKTVDRTSNPVPYITSNAPMVLGGDQRYKNDQYFKGSIQSMAFYSDIRTGEEIATDVTSYGSDGLVLRYDMSSIASDAAVVTDLSGNGMHASFERWIEPADKEEVKDYDFSFAVVGDTQIINNYKTDTFQLAPLYEWIKNNVETKKIKYVLGMGDITENQTDAEYQHAVENIQKLDGVVPYSLIRGNHDNRDERFSEFFNYTGYTSQISGRFAEDSLNNVWMEFSVGTLDYLVLALDYGPSDEVLTWAGKVIEAHPEHNVIITTHAYLYRDGTTIDANSPSDQAAPTNTSPAGYNNGDHIWDKLGKKYENIVLILSGHDSSYDVVVTQTEGDNGNIVTQMLIDQQGMDANYIAEGLDPTGMVTMFYFSNGGSTIELECYSTIRNQYWPESRTFTINVMGCEHENTTSHTKVEPTCTTKGNEAYTSCDDCGAVVEGTNVEIAMKSHTLTHYAQIDATPIADGRIEYWECSECNQKFRDEAATQVVENLVIPQFGEELKFASASVTLGNSVSLSLKVDKDLLETSKYEKPFVKFILNNKETVVTDYTIIDNKYVFDFGKVAPHQMNDTVYATLCAYCDGKLYSSTITEYSVGTYCYNLLEEYASDEKTRTVLVDLLNYGAAAQTYMNYNTENLVNANLTDTQQTWASAAPTLQTVVNKEYATVTSPTVTWKSAGLNLKDSVTLRFKIATDSVENLSIKVTTANGEIANIYSNPFEKIEDGSYYVYFGGLTMAQMRETVDVIIYNGETAVSNTLRYSIESYAYANQSGSNGLGDLMSAMMKLGDSTSAYLAQ